MSSTADPKDITRPMGQQDLARVQREMEARRLAMLKVMEDSDAKLKSLLRSNQPSQ